MEELKYLFEIRVGARWVGYDLQFLGSSSMDPVNRLPHPGSVPAADH